VDGGERWICNICKCVNTTADYYFSKLNQYNIRADSGTRIELANGSYEFIANKTYAKNTKPSEYPVYVFLIDVSLSAVNNNFLNAVIESIKDTIVNECFQYDKTKVAIITYDTSIHFYNLKNTQPIMLCVSDDEMFLPCPLSNLLVNLQEYQKNILNLLDHIQNSFINNSCKDSNKLFTAINAAYSLLATKGDKNQPNPDPKNMTIGGKLVIFNSSSSITNHPKMKSKNAPNLPKDEIIYAPTDDKQLSTMGINLTNENIGIDLFVTSEGYTVR
jgi:protein transport protein SEC24